MRESRRIQDLSRELSRTLLDENGSIAVLDRTELELRHEIEGLDEEGPTWRQSGGRVRSELEVLQSIQKIDHQLKMMGGGGKTLDFKRKSKGLGEKGNGKRKFVESVETEARQKGRLEEMGSEGDITHVGESEQETSQLKGEPPKMGDQREQHISKHEEPHQGFQGNIYNSNMPDIENFQNQTQFRVHNATDFNIEQDRRETHVTHTQMTPSSQTQPWPNRQTQQLLDPPTENILEHLKDNKSEDFSAMLDGEIQELESRQKEIDQERRQLLNGRFGRQYADELGRSEPRSRFESKQSQSGQESGKYQAQVGYAKNSTLQDSEHGVSKENLAPNNPNARPRGLADKGKAVQYNRFSPFQRRHLTSSQLHDSQVSLQSKVSQVRGRPSRLPPLDERRGDIGNREREKGKERDSSVDLLREAREIIANFRKKKGPVRGNDR